MQLTKEQLISTLYCIEQRRVDIRNQIDKRKEKGHYGDFYNLLTEDLKDLNALFKVFAEERSKFK